MGGWIGYLAVFWVGGMLGFAIGAIMAMAKIIDFEKRIDVLERLVTDQLSQIDVLTDALRTIARSTNGSTAPAGISAEATRVATDALRMGRSSTG